LPEPASRRAPPSRRLGGELTSVGTNPGVAAGLPYRKPVTPRSGTCSGGSTASTTIVSARSSSLRKSKRPSLQETQGDSVIPIGTSGRPRPPEFRQ
jgi:hypothetical protein